MLFIYYGNKHRKSLKNPKAVGIDDLSGRFLKDDSRVLSKPISELCSLSIY